MKSALPYGLTNLSADNNEFEEEIIFDNSRHFAMNYEIFKQRGTDGRLRKTAAFWIMYLDLMKYQHMTHTTIRENDLKLRIHAFYMKSEPPDGLMNLSADNNEFEEEIIFGNSCDFAMNYQIFKERGPDGRLRKTAKFWTMYLDLMKYQHMTHTAVQENDLELRIHAWESMPPFYFLFNKIMRVTGRTTFNSSATWKHCIQD